MTGLPMVVEVMCDIDHRTHLRDLADAIDTWHQADHDGPRRFCPHPVCRALTDEPETGGAW